METKQTIVALWWEDKDLYIENTEGEVFCFKNAYCTSIKWNGLNYTESESNNTESITFVGNNKKYGQLPNTE